ncbi:hypothetical protein F4820DRAFT_471325 [Hypoxylon rubiginosum]|uniref:Uncharacterized protein n=1 Tax=Hypoxylon rubiginosum TaxID=110542 RepID=A0ACB9ZES9_9PEZI|nr:hypothetical protein F4820DRAFT_471325 [Hypoxylon rubiginosum]
MKKQHRNKEEKQIYSVSTYIGSYKLSAGEKSQRPHPVRAAGADPRTVGDCRHPIPLLDGREREGFSDVVEGLPPSRFQFDKQDGGKAEMSLWKTMLIRFNATPLQLFTYGLKPQGTYVSDLSVCLDPEFCLDLERICTHPIWDGDLGKLRYALQSIVRYEVGKERHVAPLGPVPNYGSMEKLAEAGTPTTLLDLGVKQLDLFYKSCPNIDLTFRFLLDSFKEIVKREGKNPRIASNKSHVVFELQPIDLKRVIKGMDNMESPYFPKASVEKHHKYFMQYYSSVYSLVRPRDDEELRSLIRQRELSEKPDAEIRCAICKADIPGDILFDCLNFGDYVDIMPLYEYSPGFNQQTAALLRGEIEWPQIIVNPSSKII